MTRSKQPSIYKTARSDPLGAGIIVCVTVIIVLTAVNFAPPIAHEGWRIRWPDFPTLLGFPRAVPRPLERPPAAWLSTARAGDVLSVPGRAVWYWARPDAPYSASVPARPIGIVVHFTDETATLRLVRYGHGADSARGGASFGYHVYIDRDGRILQGAPLGRRTNHIKSSGAPARTGVAPSLDNGNSIGVSLVGACQSPKYSPITYRCQSETTTVEQLEAGMAVIKSLQTRFGLACSAVWGHGDLQTDRKSFEGLTLSRKARQSC